MLRLFNNSVLNELFQLIIHIYYTLLLKYASETWTLTKRDRKQLNIFERKVYRRILGPVYDNEKKIGGY